MIGSFEASHENSVLFHQMWQFQNQFLCLWIYALQHCSSIQNLSLNPLKNSRSLLICIAMFMWFVTLVICYNLVTKLTAWAMEVLYQELTTEILLVICADVAGTGCGSECMDRLVPHHRGWCCCFSYHCCYYCHQSASNTRPQLLPGSPVAPRAGPDSSTMWPSHLLGGHAARQAFWPWPVSALSTSPLAVCLLYCPIGFDPQHKFKVKIMSFKAVRAEYWTKCKIPEWPPQLHVLLLDLSLCMGLMLSPENCRSQCAKIFECQPEVSENAWNSKLKD